MAHLFEVHLFLIALPLVFSVTPLSVQFRGHKALYRPSREGDDPGSPVYLTPYIKAGQTSQGIDLLYKMLTPSVAELMLYVFLSSKLH